MKAWWRWMSKLSNKISYTWKTFTNRQAHRSRAGDVVQLKRITTVQSSNLQLEKIKLQLKKSKIDTRSQVLTLVPTIAQVLKSKSIHKFLKNKFYPQVLKRKLKNLYLQLRMKGHQSRNRLLLWKWALYAMDKWDSQRL